MGENGLSTFSRNRIYHRQLHELFTKAKENLQKYWGYPDFRPGQDEVVKSVFEGKDTLVLFPTGGGKSLCYQVPATVFEGMTLVISPLVALMQDQVQQLKERGISATFINSTIPGYEVEQRLVNARNGMYKLLYCAPERLKTSLFQSELERLNIELVAIDEAHCISEWGHDFRPSYREIRPSLEPIADRTKWIALTATATPEVQRDILKNLQFKDPEVASQGFSRPNLKWWVVHTENKSERILTSIKKAAQQGNGLMYGGTRRNCEDWSERMNRHNIKTEAYHAGIESERRKEIQQRWITGETPLVVATNAFGMGIDKPDCRYVIHEEMPYSLEAYYQEAGRAGRDGKESYPILFYRESDYTKARRRLQENYPTREEMGKVYNALADSLNLAVGSEMNELAAYQLDNVQTRCSLPKIICASAIRLMEQFGLIALNEEIPPAVSLQFTLSPEMLGKFKERIQNGEKAEFVDRLERMFGHFAFSEMVDLDLDFVLQRLDVTRNQLIKALNVFMQNDQILMFAVYDERSQIKFLHARSGQLPLSKDDVEGYRENLIRKLDLMKGYAETRQCREVYLRSYFGDTGAAACGHCDVCLSRGKEEYTELSTSDIRQGFDLLIESGKSEFEVQKELGWSKEKISKLVQYLVSESMVQPDEQKPGYYSLTGMGEEDSESEPES